MRFPQRSARAARPASWIDVCPPHDGRLYAIVFAIVLQCFPSTPPSCAGWTSRAQATAPLPAAPRGSSPSPALPTVRVRHARAPVRTPVARHVPLSPGMLHGRLWWTPLVRLLEPQTSPRCPSAQAHALIPASRHVPACAAVIVRASRGVRQACWPPSWSTGCVPTGDRGAYLRETPRVPTGDRGAYLRETPRVPTGDEFPCKPFTEQRLMHP